MPLKSVHDLKEQLQM